MRRRILIIAGVVVLALALTGGAIAVDAQNEESSATGPDAERAAAVAVESVGGGRAHEVERDPEGLRVWKVEVVNNSGVLVDVELDGNYHVVQNPDDDVNEAPEAPETPEQDAADDAADANEPDDDVGDVHEPDDVGDTEDGPGDDD